MVPPDVGGHHRAGSLKPDTVSAKVSGNERPTGRGHTTMLEDFKDFLLRGNLIELAVAFVMAGAFGAVVTSFTENIIMQIVALIFGQPSFDSLVLTIGDTPILYGAFLTVLINFVFIAAAVFFFVVKPYNAYKARAEASADEAPSGPSEIDLLVEIRDALQRG